MAKDSKPDAGARNRQRAEDADERRFNETLRRMLNTPPKPHKATDHEHPFERRGAGGKKEAKPPRSGS